MNNDLSQSGYVFDTSTKIWRKASYESIQYSDGEVVEERLAKIINEARDVSVMSLELRKHCTDWVSTYYLHPNRANLLRPVESFLKGDVLEIGCGCGSITRFLGENGANVLALEGSIRRASIAASRTRDLKNVTILSENFNDFKTNQRFDAITLVGVLEYARVYSKDSTQDGIDIVLQLAQSLLKPDGVLMVAIENQLGLKYFAGFSEDHFGKLMYGIEDHYNINSVTTFGRNELGGKLTAAGLPQQSWWFPFPDYKLPTLLVSEEGALPLKEFNIETLVKSASSVDFQHPNFVYFKQERALSPVIRNGLLPELSNSFLLVASQQSTTPSPQLELALHYATDRRLEFAKKVVFAKGKDNSITVTSSALYTESSSSENLPLKLVLSDALYFNGEVWQDNLFNIITKPIWLFEEVQCWFDRWFELFCEFANIASNCDLNKIKVEGKYFDAIPRNLVISKSGKSAFIDNEWIYHEDLDVRYIIFRAIFISLISIRTSYITTPSDLSDARVLNVVTMLMDSKGISIDKNQIETFIMKETAISQMVRGYGSQTYAEILDWLYSLQFSDANNQVGMASKIENYQEEVIKLKQLGAAQDAEIVKLKQALSDRDVELTELGLGVIALFSSTSWRVTLPLRIIATRFRLIFSSYLRFFD